MDKKYEILKDKSITIDGHTLYRIKLLISLPFMPEGTLGGFVESEYNLSQEGDCWIADEAAVYGHSVVTEGGWVGGSSRVYGHSIIRGTGYIDDAVIIRSSEIKDKTVIKGSAILQESSIGGSTIIEDNARLENVRVPWRATINGDCYLKNVSVCGEAYIQGNAVIENDLDYTVIHNFWSSGRTITYTRSNRMWATGCFYGTGEELVKKAYVDSKEKGDQFKLLVRYVEGAYALKEGKAIPFVSRLFKFIEKNTL